MPPLIYEHLKLDLRPFKLPFSGVGGGPESPPIPRIPDRPAHASRLRRQLDAVVAGRPGVPDDEVPEKERGFHLTLRARTDVGLQPTGTLAEVLSIKGDGKEQRVNVFISDKSLETFRKRIASYGDYDEGEPGRRPFSFQLLESAGRFDATRLEDLWTDDGAPFPGEDGGEQRWEVWLRAGAVGRVRSFAGHYGIECEPGQTDFSGVSVLRMRARGHDLSRFVEATSAVLELKACSSLTLELLSLRPTSQRRLTGGATDRLVAPPADAPRICILDTGVRWTHPLLAPAIGDADCHTLNEAWERSGWNPHGTRVAGLALYGDLQGFLGSMESLRLTTRLESCVVLRPDGGPASPHEGLGEIVAAIGLLEATRTTKRVFCLASSEYRGANDGRPTKLSGSVDQLAWGYNGAPRLFCVAAGNLLDEPLLVAGYPGRNEASGIGSPGQALNALTVGGCTFRDEHPHGGRLLCPGGGLSASTRTSRSWMVRRATKPDLVHEAGNLGRPTGRGGTECERLPEIDPLTTNNDGQRLLATLGETSAATAAVAGMAGRLMAEYPDYWPETIRALLVHSASWTPAMRERGRGLTKDDGNELILSLFGWGVPDERDALRSASNRLTLVVEGSLVPFRLDGKKVRLNECAYHPLPWPRIALQALGDTATELRVTLSYFVQPDMRAVSARQYADYPSHRLAFDLKGPDDDDLDAVRRRNRALNGARRAKPPTRTERNWLIGGALRERGTIHHDVWMGAAEELARQDAIRVSPRGGWWNKAAEYAGTSIRYSLVVSIRTPEASQDIYQEALVAVSPLARARIRVIEPYLMQGVPVRG